MKVAIVHSAYRANQPSGENDIVGTHIRALERAGVEAHLIESRSPVNPTIMFKVRTAGVVATGLGRSPMEAVRQINPDVVHVHNLFPNFGRHWMHKVASDFPMVATMHNYRPLCAAATLYRDGEPCTKCVDRESGIPAIVHACYNDSRLQSLPLAVSTKFGADPVLRAAHIVTTLSDEMSAMYSRAGVPPHKLRVHENFVESDSSTWTRASAEDAPWVYAGRLTVEKGIVDLVERWPQRHRLIIAGSGPAYESIRSSARGKNIVMLGQLSKCDTVTLIAAAKGLVFPTQWLEGVSLACIESLSVGTPILVAENSPAARILVAHGVAEVIGQDLDSSLMAASKSFPALRAQSRRAYEENYSESSWMNRVLCFYNEAQTASTSGNA